MSKHGKCHLCDATCLQCKGPESEDCISCPERRLFEDGRCVIRCQSGRYDEGGQCQLCHHTCRTCTDEGPDKCTSCDTDRFGVARFFFHSQCRENCPESFFHSARMRCEPCPTECVICAASDRCLHCSPGHKLKNGHCIPLECNTGEVEDAENEGCLPCDEGCEKCQRNDLADQEQETVCLKCEDGYYQLGTDCHQSCPDRTYSDNNAMVCAPCEYKHCAICDQSQCYWCEEGYYVSDGECVDACEEGFFVDDENQECEPCHRNCRTCGGPRYDDCDSCEDGFTLRNGECLEGRQLEACPEQYFRSSQDKCELCHSTCKTCFAEGRENCSSCHSGYFLTPHQTCLSHCPSGTFANKITGKCEECLEGCVMCQDAKVCQQCHKEHYLQDGLCVVECQRGFPQDGVCQPCAPECGACEESPSHCLSCEKQFLLLAHSCMSHCPDGYYANVTKCHRCPDHCIECNHDGLCKKCAEYYFLHEDKCIDDCPKGYFASEKQQDCVRCHHDCASCDGPSFDDCDVCRNPKAVRYNGECLPQCLNSTYYDKNTNECRDCDKSCLTCSGPEPSHCLSCGTNRDKDASGHCVWYTECPLHSYMEQNGECQQCHKLCHRCSGPGKDQCLSCSEPRFLLNSTCLEQCPLGYYIEDEVGRRCERCHISCQSCVGRHSLECVTCKAGLFKVGRSCVEACPESHFGDMTTMVCERCDPSCHQCWGPGSRNCLNCREGFVYLRQWMQCLQRCPPGYYKDKWSTTCHKCHPTCKTCSGGGALACLSCHDGYHFMGGICDNPCFVGFYAASQDPDTDQPNCKACDPSCEGCHGPSTRDCTLCPASKVLSDDGRCLSCCGNETQRNDKPIPRECCDCKSSQEECIMGANFVMRTDDDVSNTARLFVTACVLVILSLGGGIFLFLNARSRSLAVMPKSKAGGYEKLDTNEQGMSQPTTSSLGDYSDRITGCEDEEDNEDDDIVYMTKDGTVYRKFRYGLLEDDDVELEYDDESYSFT